MRYEYDLGLHRFQCDWFGYIIQSEDDASFLSYRWAKRLPLGGEEEEAKEMEDGDREEEEREKEEKEEEEEEKKEEEGEKEVEGEKGEIE